jgi:hypothetical protein
MRVVIGDSRMKAILHEIMQAPRRADQDPSLTQPRLTYCSLSLRIRETPGSSWATASNMSWTESDSVRARPRANQGATPDGTDSWVNRI